MRKYLLVGILILRFFFDLTGEWTPGDFFPDKITLLSKKEWNNYISSDDKDISRTAYRWLDGKGYITDVSLDRPKLRESQTWPTALRNRYNIWYHAGIIRIYEFLNGVIIRPDDENNLPDSYFSFFSVLFFILKWLLTLFSFYYLRTCCRLFFNGTLSDWVLIVYAIYPSCFYIFPINMWDTLAAPLTLIIVAKFILVFSKKNVEIKQLIALGLLSAVAFTIKFHVFVIILLMSVVIISYNILKRKKQVLLLPVIVLLFHLLVFIPLWVTTYKTFGHATFSTQSGINLFAGHNPIARGSWSPVIWEKNDSILISSLNKHKAELASDEYTETEAYKKMALEWAFNHPKEEIWLSARKIVIYFLPHNFMSWKWNPINLITHLGFLLLSLIMLIHFRNFDLKFWLLLATGWSMLAFNVLFFVEYRWRYIVEPEMLLCAFIAYKICWDKYAGNRELNFKNLFLQKSNG